MMSRRFFAGCGICALTGFIATDANAETAPITRKVLSQIDGPAEGYTTIVAETTIAASAMVPRHTHPGVESSYVTSGGGALVVDGKDDEPMKPGGAFQIPVRTIHAFKNGATPTVLISTYVVEKGKPLASPA